MGIGGTDYSKIPARYQDYLERIDPHAGTGNALSIAANRISYVFNFRGPSLAIDTACSSGSVAVHLAVQSLRQRQCDAALAGAVNLILTPEATIAFSKARMLSTDGTCRPFDAKANGYVRGEGCGVIVLKLLSDALAGGDNVLAVIRGSAVNQDGRTSGITAPSAGSQRAVIQTALAEAGLSADQVGYIEAHGTGTPLGDPIEIQAMSGLFASRCEGDWPCYVSSVKANIGHTETVSGIAGLIKTVLILQEGRIFPQPHLKELNPNISLEGTNIVIPTEEVPWETEGRPRIAGVSSFGFGGTNSHLVLEAATSPPPAEPQVERPVHLLPLSAKTDTALRTMAERYAEHLEARPDLSVADVCYTAASGRSHFSHRAAVATESREQLLKQLHAVAQGKRAKGVQRGTANTATAPKVAMLFTGQGSQYVGMGRQLFDTQPSFRKAIEQCDEILADLLDQSLLSILYPEPGRESPLDETFYTQPALFAIEYALASLWRSWGIEPAIVLGHSVGEYVACSIADVFSLEDGLRLVAIRARLMQQLPPDGRMAVIFIGADQVGQALEAYQNQVAIAAANGPENTTISGQAEAVDRLVQQFEAAGIGTQVLSVSHAFHSPLMEPMLDEFQQAAEEIEYRQPRIPIVSNLTGAVLLDQPPDAEYWRSHVRSTVQFAAGMRRLADTHRTDTPPAIRFDEVQSRALMTKTREEFYQLMASRGLAYGTSFQGLDNLRFTGREATADVLLDGSVLKELDQYHLHPALGDACLQLLAGVVPLESDGSFTSYTYMPTSVGRVRIHGKPTRAMRVYAVRTSGDEPSPETVTGDVFLADADGSVLVELIGLEARRLGRTSLGESQINLADCLYRTDWREQPLAEVSPDTRRAFLIFADQSGVAMALADTLRGRGNSCAVVYPDEIDPLAEADYKRLLHQMIDPHRSGAVDVLHFFSLDVPLPSADDVEALQTARRLGTASVLRLVQQSARLGTINPPRLWLVTRGAQSVPGQTEPVTVSQTPLWGMGRVAAVEHPELRCRLIDLDPAEEAAGSAAALLAELDASDDENQIAYRAGKRLVARLVRDTDVLPAESDKAGDATLALPTDGPFRLRLRGTGSFDVLEYESCPRRKPDAGQVEVEVHAAGLNFSDVLKVMGLYPGITDAVVPLGIECSGVVSAVGEGVERFQVGHQVVGVAPYSFASHAVTAEYALVHKPENLDYEQACTIPITFLTAYYALRRLANIQPGERVLIHAGAGGVGLAAIQIGQQVGCQIFATAGSDQKRVFLRSLGVPHVMNSRTFEFADQIMEITGRQGVDVVLNSLPGDAITRSLGGLAPYGRFLEIGKVDIYQNKMIGLLPFQDNLSYFAIDLDRMLRQRPDYIRAMFAEMMEFFRKGEYRPLPLTRFSASDIVGAFRYMAQRRNIGKVVAALDDRPGAEDRPVEEEKQPLVRPDASYLITGGLGALGTQVADWLVEEGAKHVVLMSLFELEEKTADAVAALRRRGASVSVIIGDVTDRRALDQAVAQIPDSFPPLGGVIHLAGVLDDGVMFDMDLPQLDRPMAPKVQGAWNLHAATLDMPLDFFVLFSSVACVLGSPGQANYAAGNAFLDGLSQYRQSLGLPATSVNWGPWAGSGMAVRAGRDEQLSGRGMGLLPPELALKTLGLLIRDRAAVTSVMSARWADLLRLSTSGIPPLFEDIAAREGNLADEDESEEAREFRSMLRGMDVPQRTEALRQSFTEQLSEIMGLEPEEIDAEEPLNNLGLDSLMGIELKNKIEKRLKVVLPIAQFMEGPTVATLSQFVAEGMGQPAGTDTAAATPNEDGDEIQAAVK